MTAPIYAPSEWGARFHALTALGIDEALGAGAAGPGKTEVLLHESDDQILIEHERCKSENRRKPHWHPKGTSTGWTLHLRRTSPMLANTIARSHRVFPMMDPGARWNANETTWTFTSGYKYQFGHCSERNDWQRYLSAEYTAILFDELVQFMKEQYDQIITRLRSTDPVLSKMLKVRSMSNPLMARTTGESFVIDDPHWVRKKFVDPDPSGNVVHKQKLVLSSGKEVWKKWIYMPAKLKDNPDKLFVEQYEKQLLGSPPHIRLALLEGNWNITEGSFFGAVWRQQAHVCDEFHIPEDWPVFRSMDWGFKVPGCVHWYALSPEGQIFVFKEMSFNGSPTQNNKTADQVADMLKEVEKGLGLWGKNNKSRVTGPADTQLWEQRGTKGLTMAEEFMKKGIQWTKADKKSRSRNAARLSGMLDTQDGVKDPGIVFFKSCVRAIATIPAISMDPDYPDEPQGGGEDHWYDSVSYGVAHASRGATYVGARHDDEDDGDKEEAAREDRGRYGYGSAVA